MSFSVLCTFVAFFYLAIWFFDSFFKSCMHYPYFAFLEGTGLRIGFLNFSWTTCAFNRCIYRWSKNLQRLLRRWFTVGHIVTLLLFLPFAIWTLFSFIITHFHSQETSSSSNGPVEVKAMLPGFNIPASDFFIYFTSIAFCSLIHELGHAMAAANEDVQMLSMGFYVLVIVPVAFVELNTDHLNSIEPYRRLRIYCAGVWHNLVTAGIALLLFFSTPFIFSPAYDSNMGVRVIGLTHDSPLKDARGLEKGDVITSVNECPVLNTPDWYFCLREANERYGICETAEFVSANDEIAMESIKDDVVECCRADDMFGLCFEYMEPKVPLDSVLPGQFSCLKPRDMVRSKFEKCVGPNYACSRGKHCLKPCLNNNTFLLIVERKEDNPVLYLGLPMDFFNTVIVDQYFPRSSLFSFFSPMEFEKLVKYIFVFSMGIGFINVIPCYGTDGHHIARNVIQLLAKYLNKGNEFVTLSSIIAVVIGTCITVPMLTYLFYKTIYEGD